MTETLPRHRVIIMGAAGRDFHTFQCGYRDDPASQVVAFTATQIPDIAGRSYPASLAGSQYPLGIPSYPETELGALIVTHRIDGRWSPSRASSLDIVSYEEAQQRVVRIGEQAPSHQDLL